MNIKLALMPPGGRPQRPPAARQSRFRGGCLLALAAVFQVRRGGMFKVTAVVAEHQVVHHPLKGSAA